jgi:hypothetical protein
MFLVLMAWRGGHPYLDCYVVQQFLSLTEKLNNSNYKLVLYNYLTENNYPFEKDVKVGFKLTKKKKSSRLLIKMTVLSVINFYKKLKGR